MYFQNETPKRVKYYSLSNEITMKKPKHRWATEKKNIFPVTFISCGTPSRRDGESQFLSHLKQCCILKEVQKY